MVSAPEEISSVKTFHNETVYKVITACGAGDIMVARRCITNG